jgi:hypothetical protein
VDTESVVFVLRYVPSAYYGDFVQLERLKKDGQFGANRTVVSVMPIGVVVVMPCEAMRLSMVVRLG